MLNSIKAPIMINIKSIRHPKESTYFTIAAIVGVLIWTMALFATIGLILIYLLLIALVLWISGQYFKAIIYGNSVKVSSRQYAELHKIISEQSQLLQLETTPDVFIYNGSGMVNAFAVKFLSTRYIILMSDLVDLMLKRGKMDELAMIIGHELGHHAAGHTNFRRTLLIQPALFIPLLGSAYSRSCELTADRIGYALTKNLLASQNALVAIALGSESLANHTDIQEFIQQEIEIPPFMGFIHKIFSTHPRMTFRVSELSMFNYVG